MTSAGLLPADGRICGTCAFWQPARFIASGGTDSGGSWPGHCPRLDQLMRVNETCHLWNEPEPAPTT